MFEDLKKNLEHEKNIIVDMRSVALAMKDDAGHRDFYASSMKALKGQLKLLNKVVPSLLKEGSPLTKLVKDEKASKATISKPVKMSYVSPSAKEKKYITINKGSRREFLEKLKLSEDSLKGLKKAKKKVDIVIDHKPNGYMKISNRFFLNYSEKLVPIFKDLAGDLKKGNMNFLLSSYLSMAISSMIIAFFVGLLFFGLMMVISSSNWIYLLAPFVFFLLTFAGFYIYPASGASSIQGKIAMELPFATIHMAAIAGSNIEPTRIFKIIAASKEYVNIGKEIRKVIAQVDIYGYDLVTSLRNVAKRTSNKDLAELFSGLATNIGTGGELKSYLEEKADSFLLDYKLARQKYSDLAGTFMDVYISILIAAPLILMMMFIVMNVAGLGMGGLSISSLMMLSIAGIIVVNIIFIIVLNMKQPKV